MPTLSVLYVVRNEEKLLERSLRSVEPIADEIVVVDTGSRDRTLQICRQFRNTKILTHNWVHDFSKTKNYGIRQCSKEWVLCLDADEMLDKASASAIKGAITSARPSVSAFDVHIVDHESDWGALASANPKPFFESPQVRVFRRSASIRFEGRVLESARNSAKKAGSIDVLDARIHHYLWRGKEASYPALKKKYYNKLGASFDVANPANGPEEPPEEVPRAAKVPIVMATCNALASTKACVTSISQNTKVAYDFYFVDNGSTDGTMAFLREATGRTPIHTTRNVGVAAARNKGAVEAFKDPSAKYICFLDNDTKATPGWLSSMVETMDSHPEIGVLGPLSNSANGAQNVAGQFGKANVYQICEEARKRGDEVVKVKRIDRFCMLVRTDLLGKIGLFDDTFGIYGFEDYDFCRRAKEAGYEVAIANRVYIEHAGGATVNANRANWTGILENARMAYARKWPEEDPKKIVSSIGTKRDAIQRGSNRFTHPATSIVVIAHNRIDMTQKCLTSIRSHTSNYELIFVDNASKDGTKKWVRQLPGVKLIENDRNTGVPIARNQGIRASKYDHIVLMDNDVIVREGWLDELFWEMRDGKDIVGIEAWKLDGNYAACKQCHKGEEFDYLGGACCLFKRKVFEEAGLLDEGFSPSYYEDVDLSIRARKAGFKLGFKPSVKIHHKEHSTLIYGQNDFDYRQQLSKSYDRFARVMRGEIKVEYEKLPKADKKLNILYLGMYYDYGVRERGRSFEQDNFYPALEKWAHTGTLTHFDFVELGKVHGVPKMSQMLLNTVEEVMPDAMFCVFFDSHHDPRREAVKRITQRMPTTTIGWFCDSHWRYANFDRPWADCLSHCVTTSTLAEQKYIRDGLGQKVIKSQWAASPIYRRIEGTKRDIDVSFVGQPHGDRKQVIAQLARAGIAVQTYGTGWGRRLSFDDMILTFNRSKINLNLNNSCDAKFKQIKGRNFEVPACGGFLLTGNAENLDDYYERHKEVETFESTDDMIRKIRYYLDNEEAREKMADAAYERTMCEHKYSDRFDAIFARAGLL